MFVFPRAEVAVALVVALAVGCGWTIVVNREHAIAAARASRVTPVLRGAASECSRMQGFETSNDLWVWDANVKAAGWNLPPHLEGLPKDETPVEYVTTSRGRVAWVQVDRDESLTGFPHWMALLDEGPLDADHAPRTRVQRGDIFAYQPHVGEIGDGFFVASGGQQGTIERLDADLRTTGARTGVAPRDAGMPAMNYFVPDGAGGLYFLSYGDHGARAHHVDAELRDVVPARFFEVPGAVGEHWNPSALGVDPARVCVEVACFRGDGGTSRDCGRRHFVLDRKLDVATWTPIDRDADRFAPIVRGAGVAAWIVAALFAVAWARWFAMRAWAGREPVEAERVGAGKADVRVGLRVPLAVAASIETLLVALCLVLRAP